MRWLFLWCSIRGMPFFKNDHIIWTVLLVDLFTFTNNMLKTTSRSSPALSWTEACSIKSLRDHNIYIYIFSYVASWLCWQVWLSHVFLLVYGELALLINNCNCNCCSVEKRILMLSGFHLFLHGVHSCPFLFFLSLPHSSVWSSLITSEIADHIYLCGTCWVLLGAHTFFLKSRCS